jgi:hypothetical protein
VRYHYVITVQHCPRYRRKNIITTQAGYFVGDAAEGSEKERYDRAFEEVTKGVSVPAATLFYRCVPDPEVSDD